ncbi:alpha/beta fold hydrolase [Xanthobacter agilis]|uniref:Pimeloyl-ACP methyl ester carboxylesterase n=1 Tax=Xanthobacter agilis TaxID=47492 RepID=A0ABU0L8X3_XANAG|nr:alpha/beta hydrolase [Xanthobacter agilis]MDQ0503607.1 pimeloyl-ACP methyl ester carboxylesterase [Xanthobacter agilis]
MLDATSPKTGSYRSQRLDLHYVEWGRRGAPPVLLVHGFRDHCRSWDFVARALARDHHLFALDLRGHGESDWANGGTYALDDFLYDIHRFIRASGFDSVAIIAHSMGGAVCLNYAGLFPERVRRLVAIEGTWELERPRPEGAGGAADWLDQLDALSARPARRLPSLEAACARFAARHPRLSAEMARHLTWHGVHHHDDGTVSWKHDPLVQARAPGRYDRAAIAGLWGRIRCPVLLVHGAESDKGDAGALGLDRHFQDCRTATLAGAGHWVHHDRLSDFVALARTALR